MMMKIMSFNTQHCLNYITKEIDFEVMAKAIADCGADIVGLNEMRGSGEDVEYTDQVGALSALTGMQYFFFAPAIYPKNKGPYGNGFLSKIPIVKAENILIPDPPLEGRRKGYYETRCLVKVLLEGGITVLVSHFGLNPDEQECAVRTVMEHLTDEKCILMGDFNVDPDHPVLAPIRERMIDTADYFDAPKLSLPSDVPERKIDYIFISKDFKVKQADIPAIVASDHRPHTATVE